MNMLQKESKVSKKISDIAAIFGGVKSKRKKKKKKKNNKISKPSKPKLNKDTNFDNDELLSLKNNISTSSNSSPIKENKMFLSSPLSPSTVIETITNIISPKSKSMSYTYTPTLTDDDDDEYDDEYDDYKEIKPKQIEMDLLIFGGDEYKEYYQMSPIETPPQPTDVSPPHSFNYFSVINEDEMEYEESLSLNDNNNNNNNNNTMSMEELLMDYNIYRYNNNGLYNYFINILNIKYANQLSQYAPNEILTDDILNKIDYQTQITMNKLLSFISYQIVTKYWFSNKLKEWLKFEHDKLHKNNYQLINQQSMDKIEIIPPSINDKQYMLFNGDNIDIYSNKIKMIGNNIKYLNKNIEIDEIWSITIKIELYTKKQQTHFESNQNENVFIICFQFIDIDEILYINDKFEVFVNNKTNDNYLKTICQHRLTSDSEIYLTVNNKKNAPNIILQSDDIHDIKHHFNVKQYVKKFKNSKNSKIKIYIKQFYGECIYGLYPISN